MERIILSMIALGVSLVGFSQESYTLEQAKQKAVETSTQVLNSQLDVQMAKHKVWETTAIGLPQVDAEGTFQHFIDIPTQVIPANAFNPFAPADELVGVQFGTEQSMSLNLSVSQLLFDGRYFIGLKAIKMFKQISDQGLQKSEKLAKEEAEEAYYMVAISKEQVRVLTDTKVNLDKLEGDLKILANEKMLEEVEVDQMSLNISRLQNNLTLAEKQLALSKDLLKLKMGIEMENEIDIVDSLGTFISSFNPKEHIDLPFNVEEYLDVQLLNTQLTLDKLNVKNEQAAGMPTLAAFFQTQQQAYRNEFDFFQDKPWYPANIWGISLKVPIFSSGSRISKIKQARLEVDKTINNIDALEEGLKLQVKNAKVNLSAAHEVYKTSEQGMVVADRILKNSEIKLKEGMISGMDFSQSESQYLTTQSEYINAAYSLLQAKMELHKLISK